MKKIHSYIVNIVITYYYGVGTRTDKLLTYLKKWTSLKINSNGFFYENQRKKTQCTQNEIERAKPD